jgi:hypothetical protein
VPHPAFTHVDELQAAAAEIADDAVRPGNGGDDAISGHPPLLDARQHFRRDAERAHLVEELCAVRSVAHGGRRDHTRVRDAHVLEKQPEARHGGERAPLRFGIERAAPVEPLAEPRHHLFVEHDRRNAARARIDDEADRVRSDVDDRDRLARAHVLAQDGGLNGFAGGAAASGCLAQRRPAPR